MSSRMFVAFLLDRTGSMASIKENTIGNFNTYLDTLGDNSDGLDVEPLVSFYQFDTTSFDKVTENLPVNLVPRLTSNTFQPRAGTNLIDSIVDTIRFTENSTLVKNNPDLKVVVSILTDGEENSSRRYKLPYLQDLVKEKTAIGWAFNFMGASFDAYSGIAGSTFGQGNTSTYDSSDNYASQMAFTSTASNARGYGSGQRADTQYTSLQKGMMKDNFNPVQPRDDKGRWVKPTSNVTVSVSVKH